MDLEQEFAVDPYRETEGVWHKIRGSWFKIARSNNDNFQRAFNELPQETQDAITEGKLSEEESEGIFADLMARTILRDWGDDIMMGGEVVPYSVETAKKILGDRRFKDFRQEIWRRAANGEWYREKNFKEDMGKSKSGSSSNSSTGKASTQSGSGNAKPASVAKSGKSG